MPETPVIEGTDQAGSESHHAVTAVSRGRFSRRACSSEAPAPWLRVGHCL